MKSLVFLLFVAVIKVGVCQQLTCGEDWQYFEGNCYRYRIEQIDWRHARANCNYWGSILAEVPSESVSHFLMDFSRNKTAGITIYNACVWLGGNDLAQEGVWKWDSGSFPFNFTNWLTSEPYNVGFDCLCMNKDNQYKWNDQHCSSTYGSGYICAKPCGLCG
ncbi:hypothetical protein BsWGS_11922 [Bradybaena similaris]